MMSIKFSMLAEFPLHKFKFLAHVRNGFWHLETEVGGSKVYFFVWGTVEENTIDKK